MRWKKSDGMPKPSMVFRKKRSRAEVDTSNRDQLLEELTARVMDLYPNTEVYERGTYIAFKDDKLYMTIQKAKKSLPINLKTDGMTDLHLSWFDRICPPEKHEVLDGRKKLTSMQDVEESLRYIRLSYGATRKL